MELIEVTPNRPDLITEFCSLRPEANRDLVMWGFQMRARYWIVREEGQVIGRLSARASSHRKEEGTLGFLGFNLKNAKAPEACQLLISNAESWLISLGVKEIFGPVDHTTWFTYRFSLPGKKDTPRHQWEPTTPNELRQYFQSSGFHDYAYYHSVYFPYIKLGPLRLGEGALKRAWRRFQSLGYTIEAFNLEKLEEEILPLIHEISHEVFSDSLLFEPIDYSTFSKLYSSALRLYDFSPSGLIIAPDRTVAGFLFAFYDGDYLVIKSIGLRKKYQGLGLSSGAIYSAVRQSFPLGKKATISALVKTGLASDSVNKRIQKILWFTWKHEYVLMRKVLSGHADGKAQSLDQ
jgi:hypothetical protein